MLTVVMASAPVPSVVSYRALLTERASAWPDMRLDWRLRAEASAAFSAATPALLGCVCAAAAATAVSPAATSSTTSVGYPSAIFQDAPQRISPVHGVNAANAASGIAVTTLVV